MQNDNELIRGILSGSIEDQNQLYVKYRNTLNDYLTKKHQNLALESEDIVSDVLIKIFMNINDYDPQKYSFKTWCLGILKNHIIDIWRKKSVDLTYNDITHNSTLSCVNDVEKEILSEHFLSLCENASVTEIDHSYLELKYIYGYSYEDISAFTEITSTQLSNRVSYLKKKIKTKNPHH